MNDRDEIIEAAAIWHLASGRDDMDWDGFTAWLEADPRHAAAYDEVALADALLDTHGDVLEELATVSDTVPAMRPRSWMRWAGGAIAASLVAVLALPLLLGGHQTVYRTDKEALTVTLADGSAISLAPHSRLVADSSGEHLALDGGAYFAIRHDPARQLSISVGPLAVSDIGTHFDIQANGGSVRIGVAEGSVQVSSTALAAPIPLLQGHALAFDASIGKASLKDADIATIGSWRTGILSYDDTPLALVAGDLSRYAGIAVTVPRDLQDRRFSGTLVVRDGQASLRDLSQLMGLELARDARGYRLDPRSR